MYACCNLFHREPCACTAPRRRAMFWMMHAGGAPRGRKRAATRAHDLAWTAIAVVVVTAVAIAAGAFYWFIY
jgi:hypothetical protein